MDGVRFDRFVRALPVGTSRRLALQGVAGGAIAGLLGFAGTEDGAAGCAKPGNACKGPQNRKCCDGATCHGGNHTKEGTCKCKGGFKRCGSDCVNTKTDKNHCSRCNKKCVSGNTCKNGRCTSKLGCKPGQELAICQTDERTFCPGREDCVCFTDIQGGAHCSDLTAFGCSDCTTNADCGPGLVCFDATGVECKCHEKPGSNGNACISATCKGISGSATGR